ncbi:MAG: ATP-binding protein [Chlorobiaceae bacterium]|nr:ATP-binding protein [Chlorobiaceae bacterium]
MNRYRCTLPSLVEHSARLRDLVGAVARIERYSEVFASELELTIHEAFVNAVRHGNNDAGDLPVTITMLAEGLTGESFLEVRIRDCGEGFDPESALSKAASPEGLVASGGRGVLLINHFVKSLEIEKLTGGCELVLRYIPF